MQQLEQSGGAAHPMEPVSLMFLPYNELQCAEETISPNVQTEEAQLV